MKRTVGTNVRVDSDDTGSMISVDWVCPYCQFENHEFFFSSIIADVEYGFETDRTCEWCDKEVTVECPDVEQGLLG